MAKANKPSLEQAINTFSDVMTRSSLTDYLHVNKTLISKNSKGNSVLVVVDQMLWNGLLESEFKNNIKELDITNPTNNEYLKINSYVDDLNSDYWIKLDCDKLYSGEILKIKVDSLEYELSINKSLIPLKLKKSEFNNITYRIFKDNNILAINKRFNHPLEDHGFNILRLFRII